MNLRRCETFGAHYTFLISGLSGLESVEVLARKVEGEQGRLADDAPELLGVDWQPARILPPLDWGSVLPAGVSPQEILGFDPRDGRPLSWPLRYGMASWVATLSDLPAGRHEIYARAVDRNGFAQPEPRPTRKRGKNMLQFHTVEVKA